MEKYLQKAEEKQLSIILHVAKPSFKNEEKVFFRHIKAKKIYHLLMSYYKLQFIKKKSGHRGNPWAIRNN